MKIRISRQELESYLWGAAVLLRGTIDAGDYKQFIFPLLFYKRLCDVFDEETEAALAESGGDLHFASYPENHRFQIPRNAHWLCARQATNNVGMAIQSAMRAIETANPDTLYGIFGDAQWTNKDRLSDAMLRDLIEHFSTLDLSIANLPEDELGQGYEYLIKKFADDSGHTAAEFYTNRTVVHLMTEMLEPQPGESVYDPTCGSGGMLLSCIAHLRSLELEWRNVRLFGQERNLMTSSIARMNCFLHGIEDFQIVRGDTLSDPQFVEGDRLRRFDLVLANPPYSIKQWDRDAFASDPWGRNLYGTPPQGRADYAFWQHILCSLAPKTGRSAILFPHGVLFRQEEAEMRRKLIEADLIESVLGLGPNLFYNSPMEACIVICRGSKPKAHKGKILFINAVNEVTRERAQSFLTDEHIERIVSAYRAFHDETSFAKVVRLDEIRSQAGNLNIPLYVGTAPVTANGGSDVRSTAKSLAAWFESASESRVALNRVLSKALLAAELPALKAIRNSPPVWLRRDQWKRMAFGAFVESVNERVEPSDAADEIYVGLDDLDPGDLHIRRFGKGSDVIGTKLRFKKGDIIFGRRRAYQRKLAVADADGICSAHAMVVRAKADKVLPEFLPFLMISDRFMIKAVEISVGSLSPTINWTTLREEEFDVPPLDQQRRIASTLWEVDGVRVAYEAALASTDESIETTLLHAFGEGEVGPAHARPPTKPLSDVAFLQTGIAKGKEYSPEVKTVSLPYLRVANVQDGHLNLSEMKTIEIPESDKSRYLLHEGDIVICEGGDFDKVGRGTIWEGQIPDCIHQNHVFCVRANKSAVLPKFLRLQFGSAYGKRYFLSCAKKTSNLASINSTQVKAFPVQLPSIQEQTKLIADIHLLEIYKQRLNNALDACRALLQASTEALL